MRSSTSSEVSRVARPKRLPSSRIRTLLRPRLAFERREREPRPLHAGEARRVLARVDADDAVRRRRRRCRAGASVSSALARGHDAGEHQPAGGRVARLGRRCPGRRARSPRPAAVPRESSSAVACSCVSAVQVDAAPAARLGERAQRGRVAAGGAGDREHRHRERQPPGRAVVRQAVAEPQRLGRDAVVAHRAEVARAVVHRRLQGAAQRRPVAAADAEALGREGDVGDAHQGHLAVAGAPEVGVEQGQLAIELAARRPSPKRPRRSARCAAAAAARCARPPAG